MMKKLLYILLIAAGAQSVPADIVFDLITIGNPGNVPDAPYPDPEVKRGAVDYVYQISKYEITVEQYTDFLNHKAASDPHALYHPDMADTLLDGGALINRSGVAGSYVYTSVSEKETQPVRMVSFYDGLRLANWMHNGQGDGDTETGAYTLSLGVWLTRETDARWALVSENEWHKAAHYDSDTETYFEYPNGKDTIAYPTDQTTLRELNFGSDPYWAPDGPLNRLYFTSIGQTTGQSSYGVCDMGGNVREWTDSLVPPGQGAYRVVRGGAYSSSASYLARDGASASNPTTEGEGYGLRLVFLDIIPEPASCLLMLLGGTGILGMKRKWKG